jgi:hypothetical protein
MVALPGTASSAEIIDRIVAVVNGSVITLSDVEAARRFGLIDVEGGDLRSAIDRMIDRRLALTEVERYAPAEPSSARLDEALAAARARFASGAAFEAALTETGLTHDQLRRHLRDDLRLRTYQQERFADAMQPTDEGTLRVRTAEAIREWMAGLRRRAEIRILPPA